MIIFKEEDHKYTYKPTGTQLKSVTGVLKPYFPFDAEGQLYRSAYKEYFGDGWESIRRDNFQWDFKPPLEYMHEKLEPLVDWDKYLKIREEIKERWRMSGVNGTAFHLVMENESYQKGTELNEITGEEFLVHKVPKEYDNQSICRNLYDLEDGYYPELLAWDNTEAGKYLDEHGNVTDQEKYDEAMSKTICGQIDRCFIYTDFKTGKRFVSIGDYKTNTNPPKKYRYNKAGAPLDKYKMYNNKIDNYNMQLSTYAYFMQTFGFEVRDIWFTHYKEYDKLQHTTFKCKYKEDAVKEILDLCIKK